MERDLKPLSEDKKFFSRAFNYVITKTYLNDRRRLSAVLLGIVGSFSMTIFMSYVGLHLDDIRTTAWLITFILALRNIYQIFLRVPLGHFSQMIGRKPLLIGGCALYSISLFFMAIATHWGFVIVAITILAIGMSCFWPVIFAYIGDFEDEQIGQSQGRLFQGTDIGAVLGALLAFLLLRRSHVGINRIFTFKLQNLVIFPQMSSSVSPLRILFGWGSGISVIAVIGLAFFMPEVLKKEDRLQVDSKIKALGESFLSMFRNLATVTKQKKLNFIFVLQLFIAFLEYMVTAFFPFLIVSKGFPDNTVAQIGWISAGVLLFFKPYMGKVVDKIGYKAPIYFTLLFSSIMLVLMVVVDALPGLIIIYMLYAASSLTGYLGVNTGTTRESKLAQRGMALGALGFYVSFSRSISTLSLTPVWSNFGINAVFITTAIIISIAAVTIFFVYKILDNKNMNEKKIIEEIP